MRRFVQWCRTTALLMVILLLGNIGRNWSALDLQADTPMREIENAGVITVALEENSINYFLYKARATGYQLEMLNDFAKSMRVGLQIIPVRSVEEGLHAVTSGEASIFAPASPLKELPEGLVEAEPYDSLRPLHAAEGAVRSPLCWVMQDTYPDLRLLANRWIGEFIPSCAMARLQRKYGECGYLRQALALESTPALSEFDRLLRQEAENSSWDWRLVAAIVYQESRFRPNVQSPQGAYGLMQFTPPTASFFGIPHRADPQVQVRAGIKYLHWLDEWFEKEGVPPKNRTEFVLAAYNAGLGRVLKAREAALRDGKSPNIWAGHVAPYLSKGSCDPNSGEFQHAQCLTFGQGETCDYVREVLDRYQHYRNILN